MYLAHYKERYFLLLSFVKRLLYYNYCKDYLKSQIPGNRETESYGSILMFFMDSRVALKKG